MSGRRGRPSKDEHTEDSRQKIIDTTITLIRENGADHITVRSVCDAAGLSIGTFYHHFKDKDDLMMYFVRELPFDEYELENGLDHIGDRISELYMRLIDLYMSFGEKFMKNFYSTSNRPLSAYMGEEDGKFEEGTVLARSEKEMLAAQAAGYIKKDADVHLLCKDICTIVKGSVFEWCLNDGRPDVESIVYRIVNSYLAVYLA